MASSSSHNVNSSVDQERSKLFPLKSIADVVNFFRSQMELGSGPDLTLLSIVAGYIENTLTSGGVPESNEKKSAAGRVQQTDGLNNFPVVTYETVDGLYKRFQTILSVVDKPKAGRSANRQVIKRVSDIIWHSLIRSSYKDRAHLQSLYSYLSGNKLDCFGVAFAVVAGCQLLGYKDVHLAISEDHAWVVFGKNKIETIEVTWHGKGHEDKRGQDVQYGYEARSWLYLAGNPVVCDRYMEVAAIVSAINPSLTLNSDCLEVADLQQNLLWLLYDMGHLQKYPMGLGSLGELEEQEHIEGRPSCEDLYLAAIKSAQEHYKNHHVYPYTFQGGYYYRREMYREAFASWANAGDVIRLYNYSRDDEEIYKEFLDIANEMIPHVMKTESSGHSAKSILRDSDCFANLLRFYDGICQWEEGSLTPILHIGWARPLVNTISKFDYDIRSQVIINCAKDDDDATNNAKHEAIETKKTKTEETEIKPTVEFEEGNNNCIKREEPPKLSENDNSKGKTEIPTLAALTAACGEKILNPAFLLQGGGQPFEDNKQKRLEESQTKDEPENFITDSNSKELTINETAILKNECNAISTKSSEYENNLEKESNNDKMDVEEYKPKRPIITLYSQKMKGLKDLLLAEKLNTHAISLQVTAQSQGAGKKMRSEHKTAAAAAAHNTSIETETCSRPKRSRRE